MDTGQATTVLTLRSFEPAFAVGPHRQDVQRRFCTLLVEGSSPRLSGGTSYVCRATTTDGMPLAVKRLLAPGGGDPELAEARRRTGELALFREYQSLLAASGTPGSSSSQVIRPFHGSSLTMPCPVTVALMPYLAIVTVPPAQHSRTDSRLTASASTLGKG